MKIDHDALIAAALAEQNEGATFEEQKIAAAATGKSVAIAVVGDRQVAYAIDRMDFTGQTTVRKKPWLQRLEALEARAASVK